APVLLWFVHRMVQKLRLAKKFSYTNFGGRRDIAIKVYRGMINDLMARDIATINKEQAQKLLNLDMTHSDLFHLTHEAMHRIKQFLNKLYRTDIPAVADGKI